MPKIQLLPIEPYREWTERHAHHYLRLVEDKNGRVWLHLEDLRQWLPGLQGEQTLLTRYPGQVRCVPPSKVAFLEAQALMRMTEKSSEVKALKLRAWLDTHVLEPIRRKKNGDEFAGGFGIKLPSSLLSAEVAPEYGSENPSPTSANSANSASTAQRALDPRLWMIASGTWGLKTIMTMGFIGAGAGVAVSGFLADKAWNVDNNYLFWTWVSLLVAVWAVGFNAAWVVGAVRSGVRRVSDLFNPWLTISLVTLNLIAAAYMAGVTVQSSSYLLHLWWKAYVVGSPPARVEVTGADPSGRAVELTLSGGIGIGSTDALRDALARHPGVTRLVLSSPGGLVVEGFGLAETVRRSNIDTTVVMEDCSSACTLPFLMAQNRVVGPQGVVGFHRTYSILGDFGSGWNATDHYIADLMRERGVAEPFVKRALDTPGWEMYEPGVDELVASGVATGAQ